MDAVQPILAREAGVRGKQHGGGRGRGEGVAIGLFPVLVGCISGYMMSLQFWVNVDHYCKLEGAFPPRSHSGMTAIDVENGAKKNEGITGILKFTLYHDIKTKLVPMPIMTLEDGSQSRPSFSVAGCLLCGLKACSDRWFIHSGEKVVQSY